MPLYAGPLDGPVQLKNLLRKGLENTLDEPALVSMEMRWTWCELEKTVERLVRIHLGLGLRAGHRIASLIPNRVHLLVHYLACLRAGLVVTLLNYRDKAPEEIAVLGKKPLSPAGKNDRAELKRLAARHATY